MGLEIQISSDEAKGSTIVLQGELDIYTVSDFRDKTETIASSDGDVTVDLRAVGLIDSSGLAVLTRLASGRTPTLVCPDPTLVRLFTVTALDRCFRIVSEVPSSTTIEGEQ
jgi:anti-anti-sigma factor